MPNVIGIDYGDSKIGISYGDTELKIAHPGEVIQCDSNALNKIIEIIDRKNIATIILGLPRSMSGEENTQALKVREFGNNLKKITGKEIVYIDERLTSVAVEKALIDIGKKRKERRAIGDAHQAAVILQTYFDSLGEAG